MYRLVAPLLVATVLVVACATHDWRHDPDTRDETVADIIETNNLGFTATTAAARAYRLCARLDRAKRERQWIDDMSRRGVNQGRTLRAGYADEIYADLIATFKYVMKGWEAGGLTEWEYQQNREEISLLITVFSLAYYWCPEHETAVRASVGDDYTW